MNNLVERKAESLPAENSEEVIVDRRYIKSNHFKILQKHHKDNEQHVKSTESTICQLIFKEKCYIEKLNILIDQMRKVALESSTKLEILDKIAKFHKYTLLGHLEKYSKPCEVYNIFSLFRDYFELYVEFAENLGDFSYLVMDVSEMVIDNYKARLLEYNFTMSELKELQSENPEFRKSFTEIEINFKNLFHEINSVMKRWEFQKDADIQ